MSNEELTFTPHRDMRALFGSPEEDRLAKIGPIDTDHGKAAIGIFPAGMIWDSNHFAVYGAVLDADTVTVSHVKTDKEGALAAGREIAVVTAEQLASGLPLTNDEDYYHRRGNFLVKDTLSYLAEAGRMYDPAKSLPPRRQLLRAWRQNTHLGHPALHSAAFQLA